MCTATWLMSDQGYELFFNRDERRTRKPALPPTLRELDGVKFLAPTDGDFGGSWIGVNEFGLALGLLNWYPMATAADTLSGAQQLSRGLLLISLMDQRSPDDIARVLWRKKLDAYPPFLLLILAPRLKPLLVKWDGEQVSSAINPTPPVTTSSFDTANVIRAREERFAALGRLGTRELKRFHFSRDPNGDAYSVCMSRPDAQTVSFSHVIVTADRIEFSYSPRTADGGFGPVASLSCPRRN